MFEPNTVDAKPVLHNYWARFELANTTESGQWVSFESYYWDYVTLYFHDSTGNVTVIPFGILSNPNNHKFLARPQTEYPDVRIKDCGSDNNVNGGVQIDNSAEPCN